MGHTSCYNLVKHVETHFKNFNYFKEANHGSI